MRSWKMNYHGIALLLLLIGAGCKEESDIIDEPLPFVRLVTNQSVQSSLLNRAIDYAVLLPEGYNESQETYPVVYLLHGFGDNEAAWYTGGGLQFYVDKHIAETVPMIYVMPQGFNSYYIDKYNGNYPYMKMFATELVPAIDAKFRTKKDKSQRAVMGYSMGGYGALILPVMYPDVFTISVPLSMSFRTDEQYVAESQGSFDAQWAPNFGPNSGATGTARLSAYYKERSPFHFFNSGNAASFSNLKILIDCGDDEESLSQTNDALDVVMRAANIPHEYRVRSGAHSWDYWKKSYPEALKFISTAVQGTAYPTEPVPYDAGTLIQSSEYESINAGGLSVNVLKPVDYAAATATYPAVYVIHDVQDGSRSENVVKIFSLLKNAIVQGKIPKAIIVEIPLAGNDIDSDVMQEIITTIDAGYRTKPERTKRTIIGNALAGEVVLTLASELGDTIASCFLFNAKLSPGVASPDVSVFYYLDRTDATERYKEYHELYEKIRRGNVAYEYRVRQGGSSYQAFINGLGESLTSLKESLN